MVERHRMKSVFAKRYALRVKRLVSHITHHTLRVTVFAAVLVIMPAGSATGLSLSPQSSGRNLSPQSTVLSPESSPQSSAFSPESLSEPHLANRPIRMSARRAARCWS